MFFLPYPKQVIKILQLLCSLHETLKPQIFHFLFKCLLICYFSTWQIKWETQPTHVWLVLWGWGVVVVVPLGRAAIHVSMRQSPPLLTCLLGRPADTEQPRRDWMVTSWRNQKINSTARNRTKEQLIKIQSCSCQ